MPSIQVYDNLSQLVKEIELEQSSTYLDVRGYKLGIYFVRLLEKGSVRSNMRCQNG